MRTSLQGFAHALLGTSLFALLLAVAACGEHPGGSVGDACSTIGTSEECGDGEVCDAVSGFGDDAYCLRTCDDQSDCEDGENCNGISGESGKGCHPAEDGETDGETDSDAAKN